MIKLDDIRLKKKKIGSLQNVLPFENWVSLLDSFSIFELLQISIDLLIIVLKFWIDLIVFQIVWSNNDDLYHIFRH